MHEGDIFPTRKHFTRAVDGHILVLNKKMVSVVPPLICQANCKYDDGMYIFQV